MANTPANIILGGVSFGFEPTTIPATTPEKKSVYTVDFGNIKAGVMKPASERKEHFGAYAGVLKRDRVLITKKTLQYELTLDEFNTSVWERIFGNASGGAPDPSAIVSGFGWLAVEMQDEGVNATSDTGIMIHHSFACDIYVEGDLTFDAENFAEVKLMVDVDLGTPGIHIEAARPVAQA